jgi:diketogulonate reductase-like aldo/keto reductase
VPGEPALTEIAARHGRSPAQAVLRRHVQLGNVLSSKSVTPTRIRENIDVLDFALTDDEMAAIAALDRGLRTGPIPRLSADGPRLLPGTRRGNAKPQVTRADRR